MTSKNKDKMEENKKPIITTQVRCSYFVKQKLTNLTIKIKPISKPEPNKMQ